MKFIHILLFMLMATFSHVSMAQPDGRNAPVGKVTYVKGQAFVQSDAGKKMRRLRVGDPVYAKQTLATGNNGRLYVLLKDNAQLLLEKQSSIYLALYDANLSQPDKIRIRLDMRKGTVRSITGRAGALNKKGFRLNTPLAAIGIRGTDFTVYANNQVSSVSLHSGGVVVSPFSPSCSFYDVGACDGAGSVQLLASYRDKVAEVHAATRRTAQLVHKKDAAVQPEATHVAPEVDAEVESSSDASADSSQQQSEAGSVDTAQQQSAEQDAAGQTQTTVASSAETQAQETATDDTAITGVEYQAEGKTESTGGFDDAIVGNTQANTGTTLGATDLVGSQGTSTGSLVSPDSGSVATDSAETGDPNFALVTPGSTGMSSAPSVASLDPVDNEVGAKESITSEVASRVTFQDSTQKDVENLSDTMEPPPATPPAVEPSPPPKDQPLYWGRWSSYADTPEQNIQSDPTKNRQIFAANSVYLLANEEDVAPTLPTSGTVDFVYEAGDVGVLQGDTFHAAQVTDPKLSINFDTNRFDTSLGVSSEHLSDGSVDLYATGSVSTIDGTFKNDHLGSNMTVRGGLADQASHAGYLLHQDETGISGATLWEQ